MSIAQHFSNPITHCTEEEQIWVFGLLNEAFAQAATAFSTFVGMPTDIQLDLPHYPLSQITTSHEKLYVLVSELKDQIKGRCYLCFDQNSVDKIMHIIPKNASYDEQFKVEFLKELDNIVTASVVTVLANTLQLQTYAYIPILKFWEASQLKDALLLDVALEKLVFNFNAKFKLSGDAVVAEFIWVLEDQLLKNLKISSTPR